MTKEDKAIIDSIFPYKNMEEIERNIYVNILLHTIDISDSRKSNNGKFDIVYLNLNKNGREIIFDGETTNIDESRFIKGNIIIKGNNYSVTTKVSSCNDFLLEDENEYVVYDDFYFEDDRVIRKSIYDDSEYIVGEIDFIDPLEIDSYFEKQVKTLKL